MRFPRQDEQNIEERVETRVLWNINISGARRGGETGVWPEKQTKTERCSRNKGRESAAEEGEITRGKGLPLQVQPGPGFLLHIPCLCSDRTQYLQAVADPHRLQRLKEARVSPSSSSLYWGDSKPYCVNHTLFPRFNHDIKLQLTTMVAGFIIYLCWPSSIP